MNQQILIEIKVYPATYSKPHRIRLEWITFHKRRVHWVQMIGRAVDEAQEFLNGHGIYPSSFATGRNAHYLCVCKTYIEKVKKLFPLTNPQ